MMVAANTNGELASVAADPAAIVRTLELMVGRGNVAEIRVLGVEGRDNRTDAGYFDDFAKAAQSIRPYCADPRTNGIYVCLNQVNPDLVSRANNRIQAYAKRTTADHDILRRRWLYIDCDPSRPAGISASDAESGRASDRAESIREWLMTEGGFPEPIVAMSGNGAHLQFPIDLPNDAESTAIVKSVLAALKARFSDDAVSVDESVFNAARICRLYGTVARKGDHTLNRPHRLSRIVYVPDYLEDGTGEVCPVETLERVAAMVPKEAGPRNNISGFKVSNNSADRPTSRLMVDKYLTDRGIGFTVKPGTNGYTNYILNCCPFNPDHGRDSMVSQHKDGQLAFKCWHNGCLNSGHNDWQNFKEWAGRPDPEHYDPPLKPRKKKVQSAADSQKAVQRFATDRELSRSYDETDTNDVGNAKHLVKLHGESLLYCHAWRRWLTWDGSRWQMDDSGAPLRFAKDTVAQMFLDAEAFAVTQPVDGEQKKNPIMDHAQSSASASRLRAMLELAAPDVPVCVDELDSNGWLLNCPNGTLDLRTGELSDHKRWQHITKLCPTEFDATATAPTWERFLSDIFVAPELVEFVQRLLGYCLTGDVSEQKLPIFWGVGANGKSTLLNAFMAVVGDDYTMQAVPDMLMEKRNDGHPTDKADLFGKRFVSCVETESNRRLAESTVKMLTGGEKIRARRMREDFWQFEPSHKLVLCTNHKPVIRGTDHGIWRRLLLVPFEQRFEGSKVDRSLPEKLEAERSGILAWLVRGCQMWLGSGLQAPAVVTNATTDYRTSEDVMGRFIVDWCVDQRQSLAEEVTASERFKTLYEALEQWGQDSGEDVPSKKAFGAWLTEQGFEPFSNNGRCYKRLRLKTDDEKRAGNGGDDANPYSG